MWEMYYQFLERWVQFLNYCTGWSNGWYDGWVDGYKFSKKIIEDKDASEFYP